MSSAAGLRERPWGFCLSRPFSFSPAPSAPPRRCDRRAIPSRGGSPVWAIRPTAPRKCRSSFQRVPIRLCASNAPLRPSLRQPDGSFVPAANNRLRQSIRGSEWRTTSSPRSAGCCAGILSPRERLTTPPRDRKKPGGLCGSRLTLGLRIESRIPLLEVVSELFMETAKKPEQTLGRRGTAGTSAGTPPQVRC